MVIPRSEKKEIIQAINSTNKVVIVYGARQVGKTTLVNEVINELSLRTFYVNADEQKYIDVFSSCDLDKIRSIVQGYDLLFIDEAQRIPNIGINLKIIHDQIPEVKVVVT